MLFSSRPSHEYADDAISIVEFTRSNSCSVTDVLRFVAERLKVFGAVLWELTGPEVIGERSSEHELVDDESRLFTVGSWFDCDGPGFAMHNLPVLESKGGEAVQTMKPVLELDLPRNGGRFRDHRFLVDHHVKQMLCAPVKSCHQDGKARIRTLNLYRTRDQTRFTNSDCERLMYCSRIVDSVLGTIEDRQAGRILLEIDNLLLSGTSAGKTKNELPSPLRSSMQRFQVCCEKLADLLNCVEVSLFLCPQRDGTEFTSSYTTLTPSPFNRPILGQGLTGWVLENRRPIRVLDLTEFEQDKSRIQQVYPGAQWTDSANIRDFARKQLGIADNRDLPPLSFMASPVMVANELYGVIKCSVRRSGPSYFTEQDLQLLSSVAARLGLTWRDALLQETLESERRVWERLGDVLERLNVCVQSDVSSPHDCVGKSLDEIISIVPQADIIDVRLLTADKNSLEFAGARGEGWERLPEDKKDQNGPVRFALGRPWKSVGAEVFDTGILKHVDVPQSDTSPAHLYIVPTREMVVVAIKSGSQKYGVLDLHRTGATPFPRIVDSVARLLGSQLGLYLRMLNAFQKEREAQQELEDAIIERDRTYQDLSHQLRTPLTQLVERISLAVDDRMRHGNLREEALTRIRGMARKSLNVAQSMGLLADLNRGIPIKLSLAPVTASQLRQMLIELATDAEALVQPNRDIRFVVDRTGLGSQRVFQNDPIWLDWNLLRQSVSNLLDNAGKYSRKHTTVNIRAGLSLRGLEIGIENCGIRLAAEDVKNACRRDWRSPLAVKVTGEGSGIGLWIVDQIMQAHNGKLEISATNAEGITVVTLVFPGEKSKM